MLADDLKRGLVGLWGPTPEMQDLLAFGKCIKCELPLEFEMDSDCFWANCCGYHYSRPLFRDDLIIVEDEDGNIWGP